MGGTYLAPAPTSAGLPCLALLACAFISVSCVRDFQLDVLCELCCDVKNASLHGPVHRAVALASECVYAIQQAHALGRTLRTAVSPLRN